MTVLRIYNRYAYAEIFGGLAGWPGCYAVWWWCWLRGYFPDDFGMVAWLVLYGGLLVGPFYVAYKAYWALSRATKWVDFGKQVRVQRLLRTDTYQRADLSEVRIDNEPVEMGSGIPMVDIEVAHEKFARLLDRKGGLVASLRITSADRMRLLENLSQHPLGEPG